jgi:hypothetical protein
MCQSTRTSPVPSSIPDLHARFLILLPKIETHGGIYFRHLRGQRREDAVQEMRALAWLWFLRLARRGKDATDFVVPFTTFLARAVKSGRRLAGTEKAQDVLSPLAQQRHGFTVDPMPEEVYAPALVDNTVTPVPDQAAFRQDFPRWRARRTARDRRVMDDLMVGERTMDVSRKYGVSAARVSQLRREFKDDWHAFTGEVPAMAG